MMKPEEGDDVIISPDTQRKNRVPPGQRLVQKWPVLHAGKVPQFDEEAWRFRIFGMVKEEIELTREQFRALPTVKVYSDIHCVTGWSMLDMLWEGVGVEEIRKLAQISEDAKYVMVHGLGGYTTNLPLEDFFQDDVLFAHRVNGEDLTPDHGYPLRLVVPQLYFWKSAKWANGLEFMREDQPGFWENYGYHMHGDPWKEERYGEG
jgi:DMSO/TMAO reductase YedYZ molybdopterin-dependent catalytic subunit